MACASTAPSPSSPSPTPPLTASAPYTDAQADCGEQVFTMICSTCHGRTEFTGQMFRITWMAEPVGSLFQHISVAMPQDNPGSLTPDEYASVVAYLLRLNGRPAGQKELPADPEALSGFRW